MTFDLEIAPERPADAMAREALLDRTMGPIRFRRASERLREGRLPALAFVARANEALAGTVRLWSVRAPGLDRALLLGPLAVDTQLHNRGIGAALIGHAVTAAAASHRAIVLVGDPQYYARFGFTAEAAGELSMPGPFERHRLLGLALDGNAFARAHGTLRPCGARAGETTIPALARVA